MIRGESPLNHLPVDLESKTRLLLDGVRDSARMFDLAFQRLRIALIAVQKENPPPSALSTSVLLDAWSMIDSCHRLRSIVKELFKDHEENADVSRFIERTSETHGLRTQIQHLSQLIPRIIKHKEPIWGWITWITCKDSDSICTHMFVPGSADGYTNLRNGLPLVGELLSPPICKIKLHTRKDSATLDEIHDAVRIFVGALEKFYGQNFEKHVSRTGADFFRHAIVSTSKEVSANDSSQRFIIRDGENIGRKIEEKD